MVAVQEKTKRLEVADLTPRIGTEVKADVASLLSGRYAAELRALLEERGVLVFREINLDDDQQKAFTQTLGEISMQKDWEIVSISLDKSANSEVAAYFRSNIHWHIDMMMYEVPNRASLLSARKIPDVGGQTEFANTYAAWDDLPEDEKKICEGLRVVHSLGSSLRTAYPEPTYAQALSWSKFPPAVHPLVWTHRSGRKSLVLGMSASHVEGMGIEEGKLLLTKLREWATQRRYVYRHEWKVGDLVMWDNTGTMHRVMPFPEDSGRLLRRTILKGEEPVS